MSWMSEKKAKEIFKLYWEAETTGQHDKADELETQLNDSGWKVTVGPNGTTVAKITNEDGKNFGLDYLLPKESNITSYKGDNDNQGSNTKAILISVGIGVVLLIILIVYLVKKNKNVGLQKG